MALRRSVLASWPRLRAYSRTCLGLTITSGKPVASARAMSGRSSPPVASATMRVGDSAIRRSVSASRAFSSVVLVDCSPDGRTAMISSCEAMSMPMVHTSQVSCQAQPCDAGGRSRPGNGAGSEGKGSRPDDPATCDHRDPGARRPARPGWSWAGRYKGRPAVAPLSRQPPGTRCTRRREEAKGQRFRCSCCLGVFAAASLYPAE